MRNQFFYSDSMNNGLGKAQRVSVWKLVVKHCSWVMYPCRWQRVPLGHSFLKRCWLLESAVTWFGLHMSLLRHNWWALTLSKYWRWRSCCYSSRRWWYCTGTCCTRNSCIPDVESPKRWKRWLDLIRDLIERWNSLCKWDHQKIARSTDHWIPLH